MIGEAASRSPSIDPANILHEMQQPGFGVAAHKG